MDLLSVLPDFPTKRYSHILPPLERNHITTVDLITLDTLEIAKRAHVPAADVRRLSTQIIRALHQDVGFEEIQGPDTEEPGSSLSEDIPVVPGPATTLDLSQWRVISTLDPALDALLDGGIPTGYVTEVTGESGSGKTQFLLTLLLAVQLPAPRGLAKNAIYISTEAPLSTPRLSQLIDYHPYLSDLTKDQSPSLEKVLSINAMDLESQDHILNYQLPVAIKRYNVGLVVIDSITSNYRAEHSSHNLSGLSTRSGELAKLGQLLRNLAVSEDIAIVVANQVSDRIESDNPSHLFRAGTAATPYSSLPSTQQQQRTPRTEAGGGISSPVPRSYRPTETSNVDLTPMNHHHSNAMLLPSSQSPFSSSPFPAEDDPQQQQQQFDGSYLIGNPVRNEILSLAHQQRFFTGWGDTPESLLPSYHFRSTRSTSKTPTLGLVWSTQIACRIALKKENRPLEAFEFEPDWEDEFFRHDQAPYTTQDVVADEEGNSGPAHKDTRSPTKSNPDQPQPPDAKNEQTPAITRTSARDEIADSDSEPEFGAPNEKPTVDAAEDKTTATHPEPAPAPAPAEDRQELEQPIPRAPAEQRTTQQQPPPPRRTAPQPVRRTMKIVFAPWTGGFIPAPGPGEQTRPTVQDEVDFEIWKGGIRGVVS